MPSDREDIRETLIIGAACRERFVMPSALAQTVPGCSLAGVSELREEYRLCRPDPPHAILVATVAGSARLRLESGEHRLTPGSLLRARAHSFHAYDIDGGSWDVAWLQLEPSYADRLLFPPKPTITFIGELASELWMLLALASRSHGRPHERAALTTLGSFMLELTPGVTPANDGLSALERELLASLHAPWTIERMAKVVHCSAAELHRRCRRGRSLTPMQLLTKLRMQRALELLATTNDGLRQIAAHVGYSNEFAFSTAFKRHFGKSPKFARSPSGGNSSAI